MNQPIELRIGLFFRKLICKCFGHKYKMESTIIPVKKSETTVKWFEAKGVPKITSRKVSVDIVQCSRCYKVYGGSHHISNQLNGIM